ncbi:MAG: hypothetical protein IIW10_06820 [Spirochaetaceae bacterium]|nr:hypothetical protein [Spirochaetaceae bacterium]
MKISDFPFRFEKKSPVGLTKHFGEDLMVVNTTVRGLLPVISPEERALRKDFRDKGYLIFDTPCNLPEKTSLFEEEQPEPCHIMYKQNPDG